MWKDNSKQLIFLGVFSILVSLLWRQVGSVEPMEDRSALLDSLMQCYTNRDYYDRELRPSQTMENLIYLIRKIEMHPGSTFVDMRQLVFTLLRRYRKDGIKKLPDTAAGLGIVAKDRRSQGLLNQLSTDLQNPNFSDIPSGSLTMKEECALHWMLSHTVNETRRADEEQTNQRQYRSIHKRATQAYKYEMSDLMTSQKPIEMGVIYSKVGGTVAGGTLLAGIALGLENKQVPLESIHKDLIHENMAKKIIEPLFASTLAGEIGEGAIVDGAWININGQQVVSPSGKWKDDCCPREFILDGPRTSITPAEINGAVDGLLIGSKIEEYNRKGARLSQVLQMYYSERGLAHNPDARACDRARAFGQEIDKGNLDTQARNYAYLFASVYRNSIDTPIVQTDIMATIDQYVATVTGGVQSAIDQGAGREYEICKLSSQATNPKTMPSENYYDFYFILDTYLTTEDELMEMKAKIRNILGSHDIGLFKSRVAIFLARSSTLETISHFNNPPEGYNALCELMIAQTGLSNAAMNPKDIMKKLGSIVEGDISYEKRNELGGTNGKAIVILSPRSKFKDLDEQKRGFDEFLFAYNDFNILVLTNNNDYKKVLKASNILKYEANADDVNRVLRDIPERLIFPNCISGLGETSHEHKIYLSPKRIKFVAYDGRWIGESGRLVIRLATDSRVIKVCVSRYNARPIEGEVNVWCIETRDGQQAVDVTLENPCKSECNPVYMSIITKDSTQNNDVICTEPGCNAIDQTEIIITHSGMRCGCSSLTVTIWLLLFGLIVTKGKYYFF